MKRRNIEKKLHALWWFLARHGSRHDVWSNSDTDLVVPRHNEINEYTDKTILNKAGGGKA